MSGVGDGDSGDASEHACSPSRMARLFLVIAAEALTRAMAPTAPAAARLEAIEQCHNAAENALHWQRQATEP